MTLKGFDISNWQKGLDPSNLPCDIIVCKATEGISYSDSCFTDFMAKARNGGKKLGMYHYMSAGDITAQVQNFRANTMSFEGIAVPILDAELAEITNRQVWQFVSLYHANTGVWPLVYCSASRISQYVNSETASVCGLWIAAYGANARTTTFPDWSAAAQRFTFPAGCTIAGWQFTSRFVNDSRNLDASVWNLDAAGWDSYAAGHPTGGIDNGALQLEIEAWRRARDVINGAYGNGERRRLRLGDWYNAVQERVNKLLQAPDTVLANEVIAGHLGNGDVRKRILGSRYSTVQAIVNQKVG